MRAAARLLRALGPYRRWMLLGAALALATLLANIGLLALSSWFIASMALAGAAGAVMSYVTPAAAVRAFALARSGGRYLERLATHETTFRLLAALRSWFYERLEPLAPARTGWYRSGDLLSRIGADIDLLDDFYIRGLVPSLVAASSLAVIAAFLWSYDPLLAAVEVALLLCIGLGLPLLVARLASAAGRDSVEASAGLRAAVIDGTQGLGEAMVAGAAAAQALAWERLDRRLARAQRALARVSGLSQAAVVLASSLALWSAAVIAVPLIAAGKLPPVEIAMLSVFALACFEAVSPLPKAVELLARCAAAAGRVFAVIDSAPAVRDPPTPGRPPRDNGIELEGLRFRYSPERPWALDGVDLVIEPGAHLALVGASGAGKTSIVNLLLRFWDYDEGSLRIGGTEVRSLRCEEIPSRLAVVPQIPFLFHTSIRENLLLADPGASEERILDAIELCGLDDLVRSLPRGLDTQVGEAGSELSAGQARRLAAARALLREAQILILDEPTEGLDAESALRLMVSIASARREATMLLITHSPVALESIERIAVMEAGRVVAVGRASALAASCPAYRRLFDVAEARLGDGS